MGNIFNQRFLKGQSGEKLAVKFLKKKRFKILHRNYKSDLGEIDVIATDRDTLVFVEVKSRRSDALGTPAEAVGYHKQRKISQVAAQFLTRHNLRGVPCRFDVVEVYLEEEKINHIENAFDSYINY